MAASAQDVIDVLRSIDASLKALVAAAPKPPPSIADDADLDGAYGNPTIKAKDPKDWKGATQIGHAFSECPPAYLDLIASRLEYFADQAEKDGKLTTSGKPVAPFNRRDAARARGWAARLRAGWKPPTLMEEESASMFGYEPPGSTAPTVAPPPAAAPLPFTVPGVPLLSDEEIPF